MGKYRRNRPRSELEVRRRVVELTDDEVEFLRSAGHCPRCGHLAALHNYHCCSSCEVPGCFCQNYDMVEGEKE
jgi:hypothetical protein